MATDDLVVELTEDECYELLRRKSFGRLAVAVAGIPQIVPINYVVEGRNLYFRTAEGGKLAGLTINSEVAFETDHIEGTEAVSVIIAGHAQELETSARLDFAESLPLQPWIDTEKSHFVEVTPSEVTGRRFRLNENAPS